MEVNINKYEDEKEFVDTLLKVLELPKYFSQYKFENFDILDSSYDGYSGDEWYLFWINYLSPEKLSVHIEELIDWYDRVKVLYEESGWQDINNPELYKKVWMNFAIMYVYKVGIVSEYKPRITQRQLQRCVNRNIIFGKPINPARFYDILENAYYERFDQTYPGSVDDAATYCHVTWVKI